MNQHEIDNELKIRLDEIRSVPPREQKHRLLGRAKFLNEALRLEETVSARRFLRHNSWIPIGKEKLVMNVVISMIVIAGLLFGGGATVRAAQNDLPGEPLYGIKTATEDMSVQFRNNPEEKVTRLMELTQTRIQEMTQLVDKGEPLPDQVMERLQQHLREALQICANMDDATLDRTLLQLRDQLRQQDREMDQLRLRANADAQPLLERTRSMLQLRLQAVEEGLLNREQFRNTVRNEFRNMQTETPVTPNNEQNMEQNTEQNREQNNEQNGQPTAAPGGPNTDPGGPNYDATPGPNGIQNGTATGTGSGSGNGTGTDSGSGSGTGTGSGTTTPPSGNGTGGNGSGNNRP